MRSQAEMFDNEIFSESEQQMTPHVQQVAAYSHFTEPTLWHLGFSSVSLNHITLMILSPVWTPARIAAPSGKNKGERSNDLTQEGEQKHNK